MLKVLLKSQFGQFSTNLLYDQKTGKKRSGLALAGIVLLFIFAFGSIAFSFGMFSVMLADGFISLKLDWLYFLYIGGAAMVFAVFGSAFSSYNTLYHGKDNDLLLSLPIKSEYIIISRLLTIYGWCLTFSGLILLPADVVYLIITGFSFKVLIAGLLFWLVNGLLAVVLCTVLGYFIGLISSKVNNSSIVIVLLTLVFFAGYYYVMFKLEDMLNDLVANAIFTSEKIRGSYWLLYQFGLAGSGKLLALGVYSLITLVLAYVFLKVVSGNFIKIATTKNENSKKQFKYETVKTSSVYKSLLLKEFERFIGSSTYLLNCGIGSILMVIATGYLLFNIDAVKLACLEIFGSYEAIEKYLPVIGCMMYAALASMSPSSAPSISLEGKNMWILQSLPIDTKLVLKAKVTLSVMISAIPGAICMLVFGLFTGIRIDNIMMAAVGIMAFAYMFSEIGLVANLLMPKMEWKNEAAAVKQSMSVLVTMLLDFVLVALACYLLFKFAPKLDVDIVMAGLIVIPTIIARLLILYSDNYGPKILAKL